MTDKSVSTLEEFEHCYLSCFKWRTLGKNGRMRIFWHLIDAGITVVPYLSVTIKHLQTHRISQAL